MMKRKLLYKRILISLLTCSVMIGASGQKAHAYGDGDTEYASRFAELIFGKRTRQNESDIMLCPGGDVFGIKISGVGVTVAEVLSESAQATFMADDKILSINGKEVFSSDEVRDALLSASSELLSVELSRDGKKRTVCVKAESRPDGYHLGVLLSDNCSGVGTVTYYDPSTCRFGGLGHGISDGIEKGAYKMTRGHITSVIMAGAKRGEPGKPGELRGVLTDSRLGTVEANTECGVFGTVSPEGFSELRSREPIPIGTRDEICEGEATIISTVKSGRRAEYSVQIHNIDKDESGSKCFRIHITDDSLIALTGGIVRGMSGSPIIQNGKLVGAVTHVMVADPTEGYGIFIENMLSAANEGALPKVA